MKTSSHSLIFHSFLLCFFRNRRRKWKKKSRVELKRWGTKHTSTHIQVPNAWWMPRYLSIRAATYGHKPFINLSRPVSMIYNCLGKKGLFTISTTGFQWRRRQPTTFIYWFLLGSWLFFFFNYSFPLISVWFSLFGEFESLNRRLRELSMCWAELNWALVGPFNGWNATWPLLWLGGVMRVHVHLFFFFFPFRTKKIK